ncbi:MAG: putative thiol-disulfide oxidoreductase [Pedosphaera sp.]|nr:putative thiol-disulfide oxidoreductase [Pedosphaera sp.]
MNTEMNETIKGWVFYDANCPLCLGWADRTHGILGRRGYHLVPLQAAWVRARLVMKETEPLSEMKLLASDGRIYGGADALIQLARSIWYAAPLYALAQFPGLKPFLRSIYRRVAARRNCLGGHCAIGTLHHGSNARRHITTTFFEFP